MHVEDNHRAATAENPQPKDVLKIRRVAMFVALSTAAVDRTAAYEWVGNFAGATQVASKDGFSSDNAGTLAIFSRYRTISVDGGTCSVGAGGDEDGLNRHPYVEWKDARKYYQRWLKKLDIPSGFYEGRATHCLRERESIFVLLQLDTHSQRSMSQGVLHLVKLRVADGFVESDTEILVPGVRGTYSAWVEKDLSNLREREGEIVVVGKYRYLDAEEDISFSVMLKM
ncbi:hypothetical protein [Luteibacter sp. E-22]|uniref:hypothetical protein n=1 Tax=Luteibacter sp. E-22 TaxID=3404050 RepID=UPI003CF22693